jgi:hypothetical protein
LGRSKKPKIFDPGADDLLNIAAKNWHEEIVRFLIERGADVNHPGVYGRTPLMCAAYYAGSLPIIEILVAAGADIHRKNNGGETALDLIHGDSPVKKAIGDFLVTSGARYTKKTKAKARSKGRPPIAKKPLVCPACAELGDRFHYSFPEDQSAVHPAAFAHLENVAHSAMSFRDELVRCDTCQTYFAWDRMWDNDVYSTPLDYVDIYRLTDKEAAEWLKREKDWIKKERAAERREIRKLEKLWADEIAKFTRAELALFHYIVTAPARGRSGETIVKECPMEPSLLWPALDSLMRKEIVEKSSDTINWPKEAAHYKVCRWR